MDAVTWEANVLLSINEYFRCNQRWPDYIRIHPIILSELRMTASLDKFQLTSEYETFLGLRVKEDAKVLTFSVGSSEQEGKIKA